MWVTTGLLVAVTALVLYILHTYIKLSYKGVRHLPPLPFFGNAFWMFFAKEHLKDPASNAVNAFPRDRVVGYYDFLTPTYVINDLELLKKITLKDFDHFVDRLTFIDDNDPLFGRILMSLKGTEWKAMRSTLTPAFTSAKIKYMIEFMVEVGNSMVKFLKQEIQKSKDSAIDINAHDIALRYANDVIATCAFGIKTDSYQDPSNPFYKMSIELTTFSPTRFFSMMMYKISPLISKILRLNVVRDGEVKFYNDLLFGAMKYRQDNKITRKDMIEVLQQIKNGNHESTDKEIIKNEELATQKKNHEWTDQDIMGQAMFFLIAGFDSVASGMASFMLEMAMNPDVQERLYKEIQENDALNGKFDYNTIQDMKYLDMVISETLRLWPPAPFTNRSCVKAYNIGKAHDGATKDCVIPAGANLVIPIFDIHRNPDNFPNPLKFDPERFSPENKNQIKPFAYQPFGVGPRNCIGARFALSEVKIMAYQFIQNFEVLPSAKTSYPGKVNCGNFSLKLDGGTWIRLKSR